jgi:prepilin-type N-terminal cleavage/methylation domain-containing protein
MSKKSASSHSGFSLVEMLVAMGILGLLLAMLSGFLISNQKVTSQQITAATLNNDTRLAFLRMSEVISQAHYIFPPNQTLILNGKTYTTGSSTLAVLIPAQTTYCPIAEDYCGFAFTIEDRTPYAAILGVNTGTTNLALIETTKRGVAWQQSSSSAAVKIIPTKIDTMYTWNDTDASDENTPNDDFSQFPITDSVNGSTSDLASFSKLQTATNTNFDSGFDVEVDVTETSKYATYLVASVNSSLSLERKIGGKTLSLTRENFVFSRAIPRSSTTSP